MIRLLQYTQIILLPKVWQKYSVYILPNKTIKSELFGIWLINAELKEIYSQPKR